MAEAPTRKRTRDDFEISILEHYLTTNNWFASVEGFLSKKFGTPLSNSTSMKAFFEVRKLKYVEAFNRSDMKVAITILNYEIKPLSGNEEIKGKIQDLLLGRFERDVTKAKATLVGTLSALYELDEGVTNQFEKTNLNLSLGNKILIPSSRDSSGISEWPSDVFLTFNQGSYVVGLDFHPTQYNLLLAGSQDGHICLWNLASAVKMFERSYQVANVAHGDNQNADGDNQNAGGDNQNAHGDNQNAGGDNQNAGGDNQNAGGDNQNADGDNQNADGDNQNAGGDNQNADVDNQNAHGDNQNVSVNRIIWSPCDSFFGVAFSTGRFRVYVLKSDGGVLDHWEVKNAHPGGVNDLKFCKPFEKHLCASCGNDDRVILWDVVKKELLLQYSGTHPVYSVGFIHTGILEKGKWKIASAAENGIFKFWDIDKNECALQFETSYIGPTVMAGSGDGQRVFLSGRYASGISHIDKMIKVQQEKPRGSEKHSFSLKSYKGLEQQAAGIAQIVTSGSFLAAGDERKIKVWHEDHLKIRTTIPVQAELPANPAFSFSKDHVLLAVSTTDGNIVVLASSKGKSQLEAEFLKAPFQ